MASRRADSWRVRRSRTITPILDWRIFVSAHGFSRLAVSPSQGSGCVRRSKKDNRVKKIITKQYQTKLFPYGLTRRVTKKFLTLTQKRCDRLG